MDDVLSLPDCPACGGPVYLLGQLGPVLHLRCRNCGMDCAMNPEPELDDDERRGVPGSEPEDHDTTREER